MRESLKETYSNIYPKNLTLKYLCELNNSAKIWRGFKLKPNYKKVNLKSYLNHFGGNDKSLLMKVIEFV